MKTTREEKAALVRREITEAILGKCLYSVNKRAKNWRDKEREYAELYREHPYWDDTYGNRDRARDEKERYYAMKDKLLGLLSPVCVHRETFTKTFWLSEGKEPWGNATFTGKKDYWLDRRGNPRISYEWRETIINHYLYFRCGGYTFHHPLDAENIPPELPVVDLDGALETFGADVSDLASPQLVKRVLALVESGDYRYIPETQAKKSA